MRHPAPPPDRCSQATRDPADADGATTEHRRGHRGRAPGCADGPHQWFYIKFVGHDYGQPIQSNENWETFDGRRTAYFQNGQLIVHKTLGIFAGGGPAPLGEYNANATPPTAYNALASLPSNPRALLAVIARQVAKVGPSLAPGSVVSLYAPKGRGELEFDYLAQLLWNSATGEPPAAEAAVFRAVAAIPGVSSQQGITDVVGRPAIGLSDNGGKTQLLLDPRTYQVIGMRAASTGTNPVRAAAGNGSKAPWPPKGTIIELMAWAQVTMSAGLAAAEPLIEALVFEPSAPSGAIVWRFAHPTAHVLRRGRISSLRRTIQSASTLAPSSYGPCRGMPAAARYEPEFACRRLGERCPRLPSRSAWSCRAR